jgi:hypothetical protein
MVSESPEGSPYKSGKIVRVATALGTFVVEILNDLGPLADGLSAEIEQAVVDRIKSHQHISAEMNTVEIQRADLEYEIHEI